MKKAFDFGANLKKLRKERGYTQHRLAEVLNISETMISKYESNTATPPFETIQAIAAWFHVSIDSLAGNEHPNTISLSGLTETQKEIIKALIKAYNEKNTHSICKITAENYELLGRILESLM